MKRSFRACAVDLCLRITRMTPRKARKDLSGDRDSSHYRLPAIVKLPRKLQRSLFSGMEVFEIPPANEEKPIIFYLHGGAYINQITVFHWKMLSHIAEETGCGLVIPNYPMLPKHHAIECHRIMREYYRAFAASHDMSRVILGGDSAGGGLAVSLLQHAMQEDLPKPQKLLLLSPWVNILSGSKKRNRVDAMLEYESLCLYGRAWADTLSEANPIVSPLFGDVKSFPPTALFVGTREMFFEDIKQFRDKLAENGIPVTLYIGEEMGHDFPILPIPEAKIAQDAIVRFLEAAELS